MDAGGEKTSLPSWYTSCDLHQRKRGYIITIIGKQSPMARRPQGVSGSVAMAMHWDSHGVQLGITTLLPLFRDSPCFPNTLSPPPSFFPPHSSSLTLCQSSHLACFLAPTSFPSPAVPNLWIPFLCATPGPYPRHHGAVVIPAPAFESIPLLLLSNLLPSCVPLSISWWVDSLCCYV